MINLDDDILNSFTAGEGFINVKSNNEALNILTSAIYESVKGCAHPESIFEGTNIGWEKGNYRVVGWLKDRSGGYCLKFDKDFTRVGFESDHGFNDFVPSPEVRKLLHKTITFVNQQAFAIETLICKRYIATTRYGTIKYLNKEFAKFAEDVCAEFSSGRNAPIQECFPLNLKPNNVIDYLVEHKVSTENVHVVKERPQEVTSDFHVKK